MQLFTYTYFSDIQHVSILTIYVCFIMSDLTMGAVIWIPVGSSDETTLFRQTKHFRQLGVSLVSKLTPFWRKGIH